MGLREEHSLKPLKRNHAVEPSIKEVRYEVVLNMPIAVYPYIVILYCTTKFNGASILAGR